MPSSKDVLVSRNTTVRYVPGTDIPADKAEAIRKYLASFHTGNQAHDIFGGDKVLQRNISYELIETIIKRSPTVAAIVRRTVEDIMSPGWSNVPAPGVKDPSPKQREIAIKRFSHPNNDDISNEWLESMVYDLVVFADCYLELSGAKDRIVGNASSDGGREQIPIWDFGSPMQSWYHVPATTMWLEFDEHGATREPPLPSYFCSVKPRSISASLDLTTTANKGKSVYFTRDKIVHTGRFKDGVYGTPPLLPLIEIIAAQFNLTGYVGKLFAGEVPKALMNVGDMDEGEIKALIHLIKQQIDTASNPFGIVAVNVPENFTVERLMDTAREGRFIELLDYYRQEICAVFGIHPSKLGWGGSMTGNQEMAVDTWYDVVESVHHKVEAIINNTIYPRIGVTEWNFKFNSPRPQKEEKVARNRAMASQAVMLLRKTNVITVNEARTEFLGLEKLNEPFADDATYVPPQATPFAGGTPGEPGTPPAQPPTPGVPEAPKPPQRPPMEPGGGTSRRPPPKKEVVITYEKGRPPDYVVEKMPEIVEGKQIVRLIPFEEFIKDNEIYVMGVTDGTNNDEDRVE
jgi:hypothetical protein